MNTSAGARFSALAERQRLHDVRRERQQHEQALLEWSLRKNQRDGPAGWQHANGGDEERMQLHATEVISVLRTTAPYLVMVGNNGTFSAIIYDAAWTPGFIGVGCWHERVVFSEPTRQRH